MTTKVGFIGAGQMARALAKGFVTADRVDVGSVHACDPAETARDAFSSQLSGSVVGSNASDVVATCDVVFVAVKPQHVDRVFEQLASEDKSSVLFVSIVAGVALDWLCAGLNSRRVIRVMPNTPSLVGEGASGYCLGEGATAEDGSLVGDLLAAVGVTYQLPEAQLDAVTGLSGSGPAFIYQVIEAMSDGGVLVGLPRDVATNLAAQTVLGAAKMVLVSGEHPGVLKDRVASPGGTTITGLHALESGGLRPTLIDAVLQATNRSKELGS